MQGFLLPWSYGQMRLGEPGEATQDPRLVERNEERNERADRMKVYSVNSCTNPNRICRPMTAITQT